MILQYSEAVQLSGTARLIAIDGLPCSGKSTLARQICSTFGGTRIRLDDFVLSQSDWPMPLIPAFPFPFIRYDEFVSAVTDLTRFGECRFYPYDWSTGEVSRERRSVRIDKCVVIDGVSALNPAFDGFFDLSFFVQSDEASVFEAAMARGGGAWEREWKDYFIPSAKLYYATRPHERCDHQVAGRGATVQARPTLG